MFKQFNRCARFKPHLPSTSRGTDFPPPRRGGGLKKGKSPWRPLRALREVFRDFDRISAVKKDLGFITAEARRTQSQEL